MTVCKKCRRAGEKLFLKGERCYQAKCAILRRNYPPGQHGVKSQQRLTEYGMQLNIKQKLKRTYGINESQLRNYYKKALSKGGNIGRYLVLLLEMRLDNIVYRSGVASSRRQARQMVTHGFFHFRNKRINVPSAQTKIGDIIKIKENKLKKEFLKEKLKKLQKENPDFDWVSVNTKDGEIKIINEPDQEKTFRSNIQMVIEYYSR
jgi:small subunit ribosomal protein S4